MLEKEERHPLGGHPSVWILSCSAAPTNDEFDREADALTAPGLGL